MISLMFSRYSSSFILMGGKLLLINIYNKKIKLKKKQFIIVKISGKRR